MTNAKGPSARPPRWPCPPRDSILTMAHECYITPNEGMAQSPVDLSSQESLIPLLQIKLVQTISFKIFYTMHRQYY